MLILDIWLVGQGHGNFQKFCTLMSHRKLTTDNYHTGTSLWHFWMGWEMCFSFNAYQTRSKERPTNDVAYMRAICIKLGLCLSITLNNRQIRICVSQREPTLHLRLSSGCQKSDLYPTYIVRFQGERSENCAREPTIEGRAKLLYGLCVKIPVKDVLVRWFRQSTAEVQIGLPRRTERYVALGSCFQDTPMTDKDDYVKQVTAKQPRHEKN